MAIQFNKTKGFGFKANQEKRSKRVSKQENPEKRNGGGLQALTCLPNFEQFHFPLDTTFAAELLIQQLHLPQLYL
jgi:hypothetical protein